MYEPLIPLYLYARIKITFYEAFYALLLPRMQAKVSQFKQKNESFCSIFDAHNDIFLLSSYFFAILPQTGCKLMSQKLELFVNLLSFSMTCLENFYDNTEWKQCKWVYIGTKSLYFWSEFNFSKTQVRKILLKCINSLLIIKPIFNFRLI